jgi:zinc/manganese transport system ATP-binding protein
VSQTAIVELQGATVRRGGSAPIWSDVDITLREGEFVGILGPNGAGKSTLLNVVLGLLGLAAGSATVLGASPGAHNERIGYLPQRHSFDGGIRVRGRDLVRLGLDGARWGTPLPGVGRASARRAAERVQSVIEQVGAADYADRAIGECSGGEQQRLLIAQALVRSPDLLLLDEPLDSLDLPNQSLVSSLIQHICRTDGVTVALVAHDVNPLLPYLDRVIYFAGGQAVSGAPRDVITSETLSRLYGVAIEVLHSSDGRLVVVGQPDMPTHHGHAHVLL